MAKRNIIVAVSVGVSIIPAVMGFVAYNASDPKQGRQVLANSVMPVIDSRELACNQAQHDITEVKRSLTKADPFVDDAAPRVDAMVAKLAKAKAAARFDRTRRASPSPPPS